MPFITKLDFSNNRQVKQHIETITELSGATSFGVPFNLLPTGPNLETSGISQSYTSILSTFSGNSGTTNYTWGDSRMSLGEPYLSALTPSNSATTQTTGLIFVPSSTTIIDGNLINLSYTGINFNLGVTSMVDLGSGNYSGSVTSIPVDILSANTLDFTGRTIWADVSGITRTQDLIITNSPIIGYVWTCLDVEGKGGWTAVSGTSSTANTYTTGATLIGTTVYFDRTDMLNAYSVNLSALTSTGSSTDVYVTGGTYSAGTAVYTNNTGGTFSVTGFSTGSTSATTYWSASTGTNAIVVNYSNSLASGILALAEGNQTKAVGNYSHAEGNNTRAQGISSHAEGESTTATGFTAHAEGSSTSALGNASHAEGNSNIAFGDASHAEGGYIGSSGPGATQAIGDSSHAEGWGTSATTDTTHAEGNQTLASGTSAHAEGNNTVAGGSSSHAEGSATMALGNYSHAEGFTTIASNAASHTEGVQTMAGGQASHAEGNQTTALGLASHTEGDNTMATGDTAHAEGQNTTALGNYSHAEGGYTLATAEGSHAEGQQTTASDFTAHAEGFASIASGHVSHAEGSQTTASGQYAHSGGFNSVASGQSSFVHGENSIAGADSVIVLGSNITGTTSATTYVDGLNIKTVGAGPTITGGIDVDSNGYVVFTSSDVRLKENINTISNALETVKQLRGVTYNWKDRNSGGDTIRIGFIAQEVEAVVPSLTFVNDKTEERYMGVQYGNVTALLVEAIKQLSSGVTTSGNVYLETQTILAEDNNIELNFGGNKQTAVNGGIRVLYAIGENEAAEIVTDEQGNWVSNTDFKSKALTIPFYTPTSSNDTNGNEGNITRDNNYLYVKTNDGWKRSNLESF